MTDRYQRHRLALAQVIGDEGMAIIPAGHETLRNYDVHHPFRQDTTFWYLTGFHEPDAVAVIAPGNPGGEYVLFVRPKDADKETWTGARTGPEGAIERFGADAAYVLDDLDDVLERYVVGREVIWYSVGNERFDDRVSSIIRKARAHRERFGGVVPSTVKDPAAPLGEMMLFKSADEIESLRLACRLSGRGHIEAMRFARPGLYEYQVQAALEYLWRLGGSHRNGYGSIVASGTNACVLHYEENDSVIGEKDLVLIDAACEVDGYSSDITRTFPAGGSFEGAGRDLYEVVLEAEKRGVAACRPGATLREVHDIAKTVLTEGMVTLGLLPRSVEDSLSMHHYTEFFMHGTSHWLGLDVHDRGSYRVNGRHRPLEPGMTFTVEPGIYVAPHKEEIELTLLEYDPDEWATRRIELGSKAAAAKEKEEKEAAEKITHTVPSSLLGIGVRIEDDILIVEDGHENLTASVPKEIDSVEDLCSEPSSLPSW